MVQIDGFNQAEQWESSSIYSGEGKLMSQTEYNGGSLQGDFDEQPMSTQDAAGVLVDDLAHWQHPGLQQQQQPMTQEEIMEYHDLQHHEFSERSGTGLFMNGLPEETKKAPPKKRIHNPYAHKIVTPAVAKATTTMPPPPNYANMKQSNGEYDLRAIAISMKSDRNATGLYSKDEEHMIKHGRKNNPAYDKSCKNLEQQFFNIIMKHTEGKCAFMYGLSHNTVYLEYTLTYEREFYLVMGGDKTPYKKEIMNQFVNLYSCRIMNTRSKAPLDINTQKQYLKQVFKVFLDKGVKYMKAEFFNTRGLLAVVKLTYVERKLADPTLGTKRTKADFDKYAVPKFHRALNEGKFKPYEIMHDLLKIMMMKFGLQLGFRGQKRASFL